MAVEIKVLQNSDDAVIVWSVDEAIPECVGFAIRRKLTRAGKSHESWLDNFVGFAGEEHEDGERRPSTEWPFQGFSWTDHELDAGDTAAYRVVPVLRDGSGNLKRSDTLRSEWAEGRKRSSRYLPYFNRGFVMSQFIARYLAEKGKTLAEFKTRSATRQPRRSPQLPLRRPPGPAPGASRRKVLEEKRDLRGVVRAERPELLDALVGLGARAHVVLANGSITAAQGRADRGSPQTGRNEAARARSWPPTWTSRRRSVHLPGRRSGTTSSRSRTDQPGKPMTVWTGSTNWTPTGLCTQVNNGLLIEDAAIAGEVYLDQWNRLRKAGSEFPAA